MGAFCPPSLFRLAKAQSNRVRLLTHVKISVRAWQTGTQCFMKRSFVSMSVKQNIFVSVFVRNCLMMLNGAEYTTFKMFVT